jgi:hypothetical protein
MEVFHNDDAAYVRWCAEHPDGYVLNVCRHDPIVLHRAACLRLRQTGKALGRSTTTFPKACATDRAELKAWVRAQGRIAVPCGACNPGGRAWPPSRPVRVGWGIGRRGVLRGRGPADHSVPPGRTPV